MRTPTDSELRELLLLKEEAKAIKKRVDEITDMCKSRGSFCSEYFVCAVSPQERTGLAGLDEVVAVIGREILDKHDLIRTSTFDVVKVSPITRQNEKPLDF